MKNKKLSKADTSCYVYNDFTVKDVSEDRIRPGSDISFTDKEWIECYVRYHNYLVAVIWSRPRYYGGPREYIVWVTNLQTLTDNKSAFLNTCRIAGQGCKTLPSALAQLDSVWDGLKNSSRKLVVEQLSRM